MDHRDGLAALNAFPLADAQLDPDGRVDLVLDPPPPRSELHGGYPYLVRVGARNETVCRRFPRDAQRRLGQDLRTRNDAGVPTLPLHQSSETGQGATVVQHGLELRTDLVSRGAGHG